ncbi:MAG: hypothetical protein A2W99_14770 [Bacteroidetes bacterium GWF2_33_16]|nr:MAG: hypothetical protein A2X00_08055 [Bacteroidetes bacterium GWE2_32_14]OFY04523.1 MAG: hypothetical protein A2W99_14770 [Bacteroidetes bacterium GWF2_33_16]
MTQQIPKQIKSSRTNFVNLLFGKREDYSLEHRFFNSVCFFSAWAAFFATITNLALGLNLVLTTITFTAGLLVSFFYYFSRVHKTYKPLLPYFIIVALIGLSIVWFFNSGSEGPVVFIYLVAMVFFIIITEGKIRTLVIVAFILNISILLYLESNFPQWLTYYENDTVKFYDVAITFIFSFILIYFVVAILVRSYREERIITTRQHDEIAFQKKQITDSITYASSIQKALLPEQNFIKRIIPDFFILNKPKDIVSGDFYWIRKVNNYTIIVIADCTGHGVPGAFMSVLGISLINEISTRKEIRKANQALEVLRHEVKNQLRHSSTKYSLNIGMDIAICVIDPDKKTMQFAGANSPLYLYRDDRLIEFKPTRNPIGITPIEIPFQNYEIELQPGDTFYMFTDGYIDQFGGDNGKKFRSRRFRHMLLGMYKKPMAEQAKIMENSLTQWIGSNYHQIDDILVFGFRVN